MEDETESIDNKVDHLEERVDELEDKKTPNNLWRGVAIAGIWIAASISLFSPTGAEHFKEIAYGTGIASAIIAWAD